MKKPFEIIASHGHKRIDQYYWLKERSHSSVINHLKEENRYTDEMLAHTKDFQNKLFVEIKGRINEKDESAPVKKGDYIYYRRYEEGSEYAIFCRKKNSLSSEEEIIANGNLLAIGQTFFKLNTIVSEDNKLVALVMDTTGRRQYTLRIKDLTKGEFTIDKLLGIEPDIIWYNDNKTILYAKQDPVTLIANRIYRHILGTPVEQDELIYRETDPTLECVPYKTSSGKFIIIHSSRTDANKQLFLSADNPSSGPILITPLVDNVKYVADEHEGNFYIKTNDKAVNYKIVKTAISTTDKNYWTDFIPENKISLLKDFKIFKGFLALEEVSEGLSNLVIYRWADGSRNYINFEEVAYLASLGDNEEYNTDKLRYEFESLKTPRTVIDYNVKTGEKVVMKQQDVFGNFNRDNYITERVTVTARDGKNIPMSIVYNKTMFKKDGTNPAMQLGYGSYGYSYPPHFDVRNLSLLDRGFVIAISHIRGGSEMGGEWYVDGKMLNKKNTFNDFIDCSEFLIDHKYTSKEKLFAQGGSAGGLLMGAIVNMRPDLYKGVIAMVPFVDVMTTMMDETIPLTTFEWKEWGDPNNKEEYEYMLSYSPYDNIESKSYPNLLVLTGLHDSQVQYWEPAKWVAKLRDMKTDNNLLLLKTNMTAGHGGASGRFESMKETALAMVFVLDICGIHQ